MKKSIILSVFVCVCLFIFLSCHKEHKLQTEAGESSFPTISMERSFTPTSFVINGLDIIIYDNSDSIKYTGETITAEEGITYSTEGLLEHFIICPRFVRIENGDTIFYVERELVYKDYKVRYKTEFSKNRIYKCALDRIENEEAAIDVDKTQEGGKEAFVRRN